MEKITKLQQMSILDGDGKLIVDFGDFPSCLEAGGLQASKALYQQPEQANISEQPGKLDGKKSSNEGEDE